MNREDIKGELTLIIVAHLQSRGIALNDSTRVFMEAPAIWDAMVKSGRLPRALTYDMMMNSILESMLGRK